MEVSALSLRDTCLLCIPSHHTHSHISAQFRSIRGLTYSPPPSLHHPLHETRPETRKSVLRNCRDRADTLGHTEAREGSEPAAERDHVHDSARPARIGQFLPSNAPLHVPGGARRANPLHSAWGEPRRVAAENFVFLSSTQSYRVSWR